MPQGRIKKLVADRGFGFISAEPDEVFFHHSAVVDQRFQELQEGQLVEYALADEEEASRRGRGPRATTVKPL
jgi:CspA family cold shock protein